MTADDLHWADVIFVMEHKHRQRLQMDYPNEMRHKDVHVLDIPDHYKLMDPELVEEITAGVDAILEGYA